MTAWRWTLRVLAATFCASACQSEPEWPGAESLSPLPAVPEDPSNAHADDPDAARLGWQLFFETAWAGVARETTERFREGEQMTLSCATCHDPGAAFHDGKVVALGARQHDFNSASLLNASYYEWGGWTGKFDSQWVTPLAVLEGGAVFNSSRLRVVRVVLDLHRLEYEAVFGPLDPRLDTLPGEGKPEDPAWEGLSATDQELANRVFVNVGKAIAAYTRLLVQRDTKLDQLVAGQGTISNAAERGLNLFLGKAGCVGCHSGPHFSDGEFHNIGTSGGGEDRAQSIGGLQAEKNEWKTVAGEFSDDPDWGAQKLARLDEESIEAAPGAYRTKSLRGVAGTAPYMHDGQLATLWDVLESYNEGNTHPDVGDKDPLIRPLGLTDAELGELEAFLETLSGAEPLPECLTKAPGTLTAGEPELPECLAESAPEP